ncbi:MAG: phage tail protein [Sulfuricella sp.]|nr:phage tail protein [Sulfuricella sp.]
MDAYIGEVRAFGFLFAPEGWLECTGQLCPIQQYQALYAVLGTTYGGDARTTFGVPDLRGCAVMGAGQGPGLTARTAGSYYGSEGIALTMQSQLPTHNHTVTMEMVTADYQANTLATPVANSSWLSRPLQITGAGTPANTINNFTTAAGVTVDTAFSPLTLSATAGGSAAHENRQPYLSMIYCICWDGLFPTAN